MTYLSSLKKALPLLLLCLTACSSHDPSEPVELLNKEEKERLEISLDTPETQLLEDGKKYYNSELYTLAKQNFESLRTGYPNSPFVDFAEIKIADCIFESGSYSEAAKAYEDFTKRRPTHPSNAYMWYRAAQSYQLAHTGVGRDPTPLKKAIEIYDRLLRDYPGSEYEAGILEKKKQAVEALVAHEERIQRYYTKKNLDDAALARAKSVEASLVPVLSSLEGRVKAQAGELEVEEVPEGIEVPTETKSAPTPALKVDSKKEVVDVDPRPRLEKIVCQSKDTRGVFLYFNRPFTDVESLPKRVLNKDGIVSVQLGDAQLPNQLADCFEHQDLMLSGDGTFAIKAFGDAQVQILDKVPNSSMGSKPVFGLFFAIPQ